MLETLLEASSISAEMLVAKPARRTDISVELWICVTGEASIGTATAAFEFAAAVKKGAVGQTLGVDATVPDPDPDDGAVLDTSIGSSWSDERLSQLRDES